MGDQRIPGPAQGYGRVRMDPFPNTPWPSDAIPPLHRQKPIRWPMQDVDAFTNRPTERLVPPVKHPRTADTPEETTHAG